MNNNKAAVNMFYAKRLSEIEDCKNDDWDGNGSEAITDELIQDTLDFIVRLKLAFETHGIPFEYPYLIPGSGELGLEWSTQGKKPERFDMNIDIGKNVRQNGVTVVAFGKDAVNSDYFAVWRYDRIPETFFEWLANNI